MKTRIVSATLIGILLLGSACKEEKTETITLYGGAPSGLIIRNKPDTSGDRVGIIPLGTAVQVLEQKEPAVTIQGKSGRWTRVKLDKVEGWVFGGFLLANPPSKTESADSNAPTVTGLESGDVACYVTLDYGNGKTEMKTAAFDICDQPIKGKKITFKMEKGQVLADSCQGDPECSETKTVDLITSVTVVK